MVTTIQPLAFFVEQIGGPYVQVEAMIPPGANPHTYESTPGQMVNLSQAQMYVEIGTAFAFEKNWVPKLASLNKNMRIVNASVGISLIPMTEHQHDNDHHEQGEVDPHTWVSVGNAMVMARTIEKNLCELDPGHASVYQANAVNLLKQLGDLDKEIQQILAPLQQRAFYTYHPSWGYFAVEYHLDQVVIENQGKEPTARELQHVVEDAKAKGIKTIFVSPEFNSKSAQVIAKEIGGQVVSIEHLNKDFLNNLRDAAKAIAGQ